MIRQSRNSLVEVTGGAVLAIGVTLAAYKILTSSTVVNSITAIFIAITVTAVLALLAGLIYLSVKIRYEAQMYRLEIRKRTVEVEALEHGHQTAIGQNQDNGTTPFDEIYRAYVMEVLHGGPDDWTAIQEQQHMVEAGHKGNEPNVVESEIENDASRVEE